MSLFGLRIEMEMFDRGFQFCLQFDILTCFQTCFIDKEVVLNNEPSKRQRRWKSESNDKETQVSNISSQAPIKEVLQPAVLKRNLSGSNSIGGSNEPSKEREGWSSWFCE